MVSLWGALIAEDEAAPAAVVATAERCELHTTRVVHAVASLRVRQIGEDERIFASGGGAGGGLRAAAAPPSFCVGICGRHVAPLCVANEPYGDVLLPAREPCVGDDGAEEGVECLCARHVALEEAEDAAVRAVPTRQTFTCLVKALPKVRAVAPSLVVAPYHNLRGRRAADDGRHPLALLRLIFDELPFGDPLTFPRQLRLHAVERPRNATRRVRKARGVAR